MPEPDVHTQLRAIRADVDGARSEVTAMRGDLRRLMDAMIGSLENPGGALSTLRTLSVSVEDLDDRVGVLETRLPKGASGSYLVTRQTSDWTPRQKLAAWAAAIATIIAAIAAAGGFRLELGGTLSAEEIRAIKEERAGEVATGN